MTSTESSGERPNSVTIGAKAYEISWDFQSWIDKATEPECLGETNHHKLWIGINPAQHPSQMADTLLHEILHVIMSMSGNPQNYTDLGDKLEEHIVTNMSPWLLHVMNANPEIVDFLLDPL